MDEAKTLAGRLSARAGAAARLAARRLVAMATRREEVLEVTGRTSPGAWGRAAAVSDRTMIPDNGLFAAGPQPVGTGRVRLILVS